jgi:ribonucleoside-diphosphate reductase alpha chain
MPVLRARYLQKDESVVDMLDRVARAVSYAYDNGQRVQMENDFKQVMERGYFLPSSPVLMNAGTDFPMLSACFVLDVKDDMYEIFNTITNMALIQQRGGGTGFNFSNVRERGGIVHSTNGVASGVLSFLEVYNAATKIVKQGGKRRSANIAILSVDHPEIVDFIDMKRDPNAMNNFNLSVLVTDAFMKAVELDQDWPLISRINGAVVTTVRARELLGKIEQNMIECGEPGIIFKDTMERKNQTPWLGELVGVNPCGEVGLYDKEACNLGSINLEMFYDWDTNPLVHKTLDFTIRTAVKFLDGTISINRFPVDGIAEAVARTRKIGLGITGLHSFLILRSRPYESPAGVNDACAIMRHFQEVATSESISLGKEYGFAPAYDNAPEWAIKKRNTNLTCIAPTGTISMILGTSSSGIEPVYSWSYTRKIDGEDVVIHPPILERALEKNGYSITPEIMREIDYNGGRLSDILERESTGISNIFKTATEISPEGHIRMQMALQEFVDNNISKTVMVSRKDATIENIHNLVMFAWKGNIHGMTVYVDGSRDGQILVANEKCPVCGSNLTVEEGCKKCSNCGWGACTA